VSTTTTENGKVGVQYSAPPPDVVTGIQPIASGPVVASPPPDVVSGAQALAVPAALDWSDDVGPAPTTVNPAPAGPVRVLDNQAIYRIVREVAVPLSGDDLYSAVAADERLGLLYGIVLFPQASVHLGSVLRLMRARAEAAFLDVFGVAADELLGVTGVPGSAGRLASVQGRFLWQEPWLSAFRRSGTVAAFQAAQNEEAIEHQFRPMLQPALALGLSTERGLAVAYDAVATRGVGGGVRWLVEAAGPLRTEQQRTSALRSLGFSDVASFQQSVGWLPNDGVFGPATHAAVVGALRAQGDAPLPTATELVAALVEAAEGESHERLERLEESELLGDTPVAA
jgi:hypothetical protein